MSVRQDESFCRIVLDLIIVDRLRQLEDKDAHHRLQISTEVPVSIRTQNIYGDEEIVKGRADWVLGYGVDKNDTGSILVVLEAKPYQSATVGTPQLLVYMAAVQKSREIRGKANTSVFGMLSDSKEFRFCFLNENQKFFVSRPFIWSIEQATIIAYIDIMLSCAIESSPDTTLHETNNRTINEYREFLERKWRFEDESDDGKVEEEKEEKEGKEEEANDGSLVDVVKSGGRVIMKWRVKP